MTRVSWPGPAFSPCRPPLVGFPARLLSHVEAIGLSYPGRSCFSGWSLRGSCSTLVERRVFPTSFVKRTSVPDFLSPHSDVLRALCRANGPDCLCRLFFLLAERTAFFRSRNFKGRSPSSTTAGSEPRTDYPEEVSPHSQRGDEHAPYSQPSRIFWKWCPLGWTAAEPCCRLPL